MVDVAQELHHILAADEVVAVAHIDLGAVLGQDVDVPLFHGGEELLVEGFVADEELLFTDAHLGGGMDDVVLDAENAADLDGTDGTAGELLHTLGFRELGAAVGGGVGLDELHAQVLGVLSEALGVILPVVVEDELVVGGSAVQHDVDIAEAGVVQALYALGASFKITGKISSGGGKSHNMSPFLPVRRDQIGSL